MFKIVRTIDNLGANVWTVISESNNAIDAEHARDFFEANWPWEESEVQGRIHYSYEVVKDEL